jgi:hypothetical protein
MHDINNCIKKVVHLNVFQGLNAEFPVAVVDFQGTQYTSEEHNHQYVTLH